MRKTAAGHKVVRHSFINALIETGMYSMPVFSYQKQVVFSMEYDCARQGGKSSV